MICARDRSHAALAEARLRALGGVPTATANGELLAVCGIVGDPQVSDRTKLTVLLARLAGGVEGTIAAVAQKSRDDAETHALLIAIGEDDRASLRWLRDINDTLDGR